MPSNKRNKWIARVVNFLPANALSAAPQQQNDKEYAKTVKLPRLSRASEWRNMLNMLMIVD